MKWKCAVAMVAVLVLGGCGAGQGGDKCKDGWETPSKGKQGACSSHGGLA